MRQSADEQETSAALIARPGYNGTRHRRVSVRDLHTKPFGGARHNDLALAS
ncbi:hypothetical protein M2283_004006 [Streptomyces pseudovenezuelae]|uniref:Uncharacterized protein n=1 Tax=Streptomyces pseudovenezuelae TaxID=67350 RepID=A0ABT6LMX5_9ACTN|nr:hypothetical protein [Streptomyces pseudovenezuelae]MDH6216689.1 hypothetical protein [Streptomyces pseudovenezuelae]